VNDGRRREQFATTEVIRPAAVLMEAAARQILAGLAEEDVRNGGRWLTSPGVWERYDRAWPKGAREPGPAIHLGTIRSIYDSPQRYSVTIFRASITAEGLEQGWTVDSLCDDALKHAGLALADCPRATFLPTPQPFPQDRQERQERQERQDRARDLTGA
jgi:hypothetical protein